MSLNSRSVLLNKRSTFRPSELHVVVPYSNHLRYQSRHHLLIETIEHFLNSGVIVYVVELAHNHRRHILQLPSEVHHIKIHTHDIMWHKEQQINIGLKAAINNGAQYLAWIDGDIQFTNPYWATETIEALQSYTVVQPWQYAIDLDHKHNVISDEKGNFLTESFCALWQKQIMDNMGYNLFVNNNTSYKQESYILDYQSSTKSNNIRPFGHFGYAWAITTEAYLGIGGLIDWVVTGAADYFLALGFSGILGQMIENGWYESSEAGYIRRLIEFQDKCNKVIKRNIGIVPGTLFHGWHGPKTKRGYLTRPQILKVSKFDPDLDLTLDENGLYKFARENHHLRDGLINYFLSRDEDSK